MRNFQRKKKMTLKNRTEEIRFREQYTRENWERDSKKLEVLLQLVPDEQKTIVEDLVINALNVEASDKKIQERVILPFQPYLNAQHIVGLGGKKLIKIMMSAVDAGSDDIADKIRMAIKQPTKTLKKFDFKNPFGMSTNEKKLASVVSRDKEWHPTKEIAKKARLPPKVAENILEGFVGIYWVEKRIIKGESQWKSVISKK